MILSDAIEGKGNDYNAVLRRFEARTSLPWYGRVPPTITSNRSLSVVIPARNVEYALNYTLDALAASVTPSDIQVIVVDDASTDGTAAIARHHVLRPALICLPQRLGPSVARNIGTLAAEGETILYLDADMVLPNHVVREHICRAADDVIGIGFRHNVKLVDVNPPVSVETFSLPDLEADHRVNWYARPGRLLYSGLTLNEYVRARPLDETDDLRKLGHGRYFYDWDLPRMVVTAMVSVPRRAALDIGGFDPEFADGWGVEDTHFGAKLISMGLMVVPFREAVGYHIDPPDADEQWKEKLAAWPRNIALYRRRLTERISFDQAQSFTSTYAELMQNCTHYNR